MEAMEPVPVHVNPPTPNQTSECEYCTCLPETNPYSTVTSDQTELDRSITLHLKISCPPSPANSQTDLVPGESPRQPQVQVQAESDYEESVQQQHGLHPPPPPHDMHRDFHRKLHTHFSDLCDSATDNENYHTERCRYHSNLRLPLIYPHPYRQITVETEFDNPLYETGGVSVKNHESFLSPSAGLTPSLSPPPSTGHS
ncbi:Seizure 6-like protein [Collichthys lucidus]|uniref:Seizure 6-like protein n=1 Tax=Collichthys lucidus TaxID=240159 RepID=A0A4U5VBW9_COLLU|nr:Seizure 6-like protein [Collichthys lucidus]